MDRKNRNTEYDGVGRGSRGKSGSGKSSGPGQGKRVFRIKGIAHVSANRQSGARYFDQDRTVRTRNQETIGSASTKVSRAVSRDGGHTLSGKSRQNVTEKDSERHVSNIVKVIAYVTFVLVASTLLSVFIIMVANDMYAFVKSDEQVTVTIPEDASLNDVAEILHENRIIRYPGLFKMYARMKKDPCDFRPGEYTVSARLGYRELLSSFKPKADSGISRITIPEGYTTDEIIDLLVSKGIGTRERYVDVINNYDFDYWFIDELGDDWASTGRFYRLDGYLFPDSYEFYNASSEETVINRLLARFSRIFTKEYKLEAEERGMTVDDVMKLASIIEKEAGTPADFSIVSSVFHNRMDMPWAYPYLESDATIVYAMHHDTGKRPTLSEVNVDYDSPYNSYTHEGLPPGPICNPGNSAILSALNPQKTGYYFFVSSGTKTYFSVTRDEHNRIVAEIKAGLVEDDPYAPEEGGEN